MKHASISGQPYSFDEKQTIPELLHSKRMLDAGVHDRKVKELPDRVTCGCQYI